MKKKLQALASFLLLVMSIHTKGQDVNPRRGQTPPGELSGKVTDAKTGEPLAAASVYITDIRSGSYTDAAGNFIIRGIPIGKHLVEVSHIGYGTIAENIEIGSSTHFTFSLNRSVLENNAVVVTGVTGATQMRKVPFSVSVMRKEDLFQNTSSNIIESLTKFGGVSTLSTGPAIAKPVIRGLGYNRVLTINDGVRQEGQQWGDEHGIEIDDASVNKIELLKGPASLIYGSDAMAGVVNIITNVPLPVNTLKASVTANYQTNNHLRGFNANIGANRNGFNWNIYDSYKAAADYHNKYDGAVFNSKFNENNFGGYLGYNGKWGYSHLVLSNFDLKAGLTEGDRDSLGRFTKPLPGGTDTVAGPADFNSITPRIPWQHIRHFKLAADNSFRFGRNKLSLNIGYQQNRREEFGNPDDPQERSLFFQLQTITYTAQFHLAELKNWRTTIGVNGMQQTNVNKGVEQLIPDYHLFDFGIYGYTQKTAGLFTVSGGLRFDNRHISTGDLMDGSTVKTGAFSRSFSNISGSVGLTAQVSKALNLKLNISRGFRAPSVPELASNGAHEGTIRYEYGEQQLKSETSWQLDAGLEFSSEHVALNITGFYNYFNNFIFYRKLQAAAGGDSTLLVNGSTVTAFQFNQRIAGLAGLEASLDIHPHPLDWLHILNTFSYVSGRFDSPVEGSRYLPFIPATRLQTEVKINFAHTANYVQDLYLKLEMDNTFRKQNVFTAYNTETPTGGYTLFNAGLGADISNAKKQRLCSIAFSALNLTDLAYQSHLSRLKYAAENPVTGRMGVFNTGRNFSIKLTVPFSYSWTK
ncbi:MAG: TonB-dependent receptor [Ferruginibacter sp.]